MNNLNLIVNYFHVLMYFQLLENRKFAVIIRYGCAVTKTGRGGYKLLCPGLLTSVFYEVIFFNTTSK